MLTVYEYTWSTASSQFLSWSNMSNCCWMTLKFKGKSVWEWEHCGPVLHLSPWREEKQESVYMCVCVCVCVFDVWWEQTDGADQLPQRTDSAEKPTWECVDTDHLLTGLHALWILFPCGTRATARRKKDACGHILSTRARCNICKTLILSNSGRTTNMLTTFVGNAWH